MNIVFITGGVCSDYTADYASTLASTLRADNHSVAVYVRRADPDAPRFESFSPTALGSGGAFDVLSPVRLASHLSKLSGRIVIQTFTTKDARLALNAARLAARETDVRVILSLLDAGSVTKLADWEKRLLADVAAITVDSESPCSIPGARLLTPAIDDRRLDSAPRTDSFLRLLFMGKLTKECGLVELIKSLEQYPQADWSLTVCGTGRGADVMGSVRRLRAASLTDRVSWLGNDYHPMQALADCDVVVGVDSPYIRLLARCAGRPFRLILSPADLSTLIDDRPRLVEEGREARRIYEESETYPLFYHEITSLYNEC